ncbi:hypothetical protein GuL6_097 [Buttiauxella phage vB_ButM_GuL6]|nr:hypothetical protein GuL6_097 [Buttiauxella phage vB_ButM_GuL6]
MAMMMKKAEFLALVANMKSPRLTRRGITVFAYDEALENARMNEVYSASNFREEGYISASNQMTKYRNWLEAAK